MLSIDCRCVDPPLSCLLAPVLQDAIGQHCACRFEVANSLWGRGSEPRHITSLASTREWQSTPHTPSSVRLAAAVPEDSLFGV